jgi:hypothetical protein
MVKAVRKQESGCGKFLQPSLGISLKADLPLTIDEANASSMITLSPNPTTGMITIEHTIDETTSFTVFNALGQMLISETGTQIDLTAFQSGVYLIAVSNHLYRIIKE